MASENEDRNNAIAMTILRVLGCLLCLWFFLIGLGLMGDAFKVLGGKSAGNLFQDISDPIVGLMVGVLATVLVQSSSTTTSVVVGLVGSGIMDVQTAIPIVMGANIGTSVTSTLVSFGQANEKEQFRRAFAGATVHDMFNYLAVCVLLPLELITNAMNGGDGGLLFALSKAITDGLVGSDAETFDSPAKIITDPITKAFISVDKDKIKALSMGMPTLETCLGGNETALTKPKMVAKISYSICGNETTYEIAMKNWTKEIEEGSLVKAGAFEGTPDGVSGAVCLVLSLIILCGALYGIVKLLKALVTNSNQKFLERALNMNGYLAILVGAGMTIMVQSSSIITSALVPLVGLGTLTLEGMLPLTLGANIGTTATALIAAVASGKPDSLQIALCHLFFNIFGILIFYPVPVMRNIPLSAARNLGYFTVCFSWFPVFYLVMCFVVIPLIVLAIGQCVWSDSAGLVALGVILILAIIVPGLFVIYKYLFGGWKEKFRATLETRYKEREIVSDKITPLSPTGEATPPPAPV